MGRFSVIVPLHRATPEFERCIEGVLAQLGDDDEVIVVSDAPVETLPARIIHLVTGSSSHSSPAVKRDLALANARGEICAFIDDDAYPAEGWLESAFHRFADPAIAAVGGPGVTPPGSTWRQRAGGAFYESKLGSGSLRIRFRAEGPVRDVDDWPAYNFFARTSALRDVGGWASDFYGGEDTKVCLALVEAGKRIVYDPDVLVFHHRRPIFGAHLAQLMNVGRHRGYFVRRYPRTSAQPQYFAPSAALVAGATLVAWGLTSRRRARRLAVASGAAYCAISAYAVREGSSPSIAAALPAVLVATHGGYGAAFIRGLFTRHLER